MLASSVIKRSKRDRDYGNRVLVLVLPYLRAEYRDNGQRFPEHYDEADVFHESAEIRFKAAIQTRNRYMVDRSDSDLIVCCIGRKTGGAYKSVMYAEKQEKRIINLVYLE